MKMKNKYEQKLKKKLKYEKFKLNAVLVRKEIIRNQHNKYLQF